MVCTCLVEIVVLADDVDLDLGLLFLRLSVGKDHCTIQIQLFRFCQIFEADHTSGDMFVGVGLMLGGASLLNLSNWSLLKESARKLPADLTCLMKTLLLFTRLFRVSSLSKYMQFLHPEVSELIIVTTAKIVSF